MHPGKTVRGRERSEGEKLSLVPRPGLICAGTRSGDLTQVFKGEPSLLNTLENGLSAGPHAEFVEDAVDVSLNSANADAKIIGNVFIAHPPGSHFQYLFLSVA